MKDEGKESSVDYGEGFLYDEIKNERSKNVDSKVFGQFIAETRKEKNMTQAELAGIIGVTDKAVSRWERGIGFPDINTLEPLANALDLTVLELMRSEKTDMESKDKNLLNSGVTEIMTNAVEMARENQRQDKASLWIAGTVTLVTAVLIKLSGHANMGGSLFAGAMAALAVVGMYFFVKNKDDKESRKIYGFFMLAGIGFSIVLANVMGVDSFVLVWCVYGIFSFLVEILSR